MNSVYDYYITPEEYETAKKNGIQARTLEYRIRDAGWKKDKAINTPPRKRNNHGNWLQVALENGISRNTFYSRTRSGWSHERSATEKPMTHEEITRLANKKNKTIPNWVWENLEKNNIPYNTYRSRRLRGLSMEEASTMQVMTAREKGLKGKEKMKEIAMY